MKNIRTFYLKIHFLIVKFSVYFNRRVFIMKAISYEVTQGTVSSTVEFTEPYLSSVLTNRTDQTA